MVVAWGGRSENLEWGLGVSEREACDKIWAWPGPVCLR